MITAALVVINIYLTYKVAQSTGAISAEHSDIADDSTKDSLDSIQSEESRRG